MPRPRTITDEKLLNGAARAISRVGPSRLTLADVAAEVGVSPATLVQRFGSKRELLLALVNLGGGSAGREFESLRAAHRSPLAALYAYAECMARFMAPSPEVLANHLAFLHIDLTDPEFHQPALAHARASRTEIQRLLDGAVADDELTSCDTARLARAVESMIGGSLVSWAIHREGDATDWVRDDLESLLAPHTVIRGPGMVEGRGTNAGNRSRPKRSGQSR
jgi:AcrR family transcriptional regulator